MTRSKAEADQALVACAHKYARIRNETRNILRDTAASQGIDVLITGVSSLALKALDDQWIGQPRKVAFRWREEVVRVATKSHPRRLDLAFFQRNVLCGLAMGRLSNSREWLSFTHIEGHPMSSHPLKAKIVPLTLVAGKIFTQLVQQECELELEPSIRIMNPLEEAITWYAKQGYSEFHQQNGYSFVIAGGMS